MIELEELEVLGDQEEQQLEDGDILELGPSSVSPADEVVTGIPFTSFNFLNSILGAGVLGMPFALQEAGFFFGIFLILFLGILTDYSVNLLIRFGKEHGCVSYPQLAEKALGRPGYFLPPVFMFLFTVGAMVSYLIIIGDALTMVADSFWGDVPLLTSRHFIIASTSLLVMLPLSLYKNVAKLGKFSAAAMVALLYIAIVVVVNAITTPSSEKNHSLKVINGNFFPSIGNIAFAYVCHHNTFLLYRSLRDNTMSRWKTVTRISVGLSFLALAIIGIAGNVVYGPDAKGNILNNLPQNIGTSLARLAAAIVLCFTYPLECFVAREAMDVFLAPYSDAKIFHFVESIDLKHTIVTTALVVVTTTIALIVRNLGAVFELTGGFSAVALAYIIPAMCAFKLDTAKSHKGRIFAGLLFGFGVISMISGTGLTLWNVATGNQKGE